MHWDSFGWTGVDCEYENKPLLVRYREIPSDFARNSYPLRLNIFWRMYEADENGLPTVEEFERLVRFEDRLIKAVESDQHSILILVLTTKGTKEFAFQTADPDGFKQRLTDMDQEEQRYPIEIHSYDDADWGYLESIIAATDTGVS